MFGIGTPEIIIIVVVALLIFGPSKLPELGKTLGKGLREFKKASSDFKDQINPLSGDEHEHGEPNLATEPAALIEDKKTAKKQPKKRTAATSASTGKKTSSSNKKTAVKTVTAKAKKPANKSLKP